MWGIACFNEFCSLSESNFWPQQFCSIDFQPHTCLVNKISSQALVCVSKSFLLRQIKYFNLQVLTAFVLNCTQTPKWRGSEQQLQGWAGQSLKVLTSPLTWVAGSLSKVPAVCSCSASPWAPGQCQPCPVPGMQHRGQQKGCLQLQQHAQGRPSCVLAPRLLQGWLSHLQLTLCSHLGCWADEGLTFVFPSTLKTSYNFQI